MSDINSNSNNFFLSIPIWAYPYVIKISSEINGKGNILSVKVDKDNCLTITSSIKDNMYRVDSISKTGASTIYCSSTSLPFFDLNPQELLLEHVFGRPEFYEKLIE